MVWITEKREGLCDGCWGCAFYERGEKKNWGNFFDLKCPKCALNRMFTVYDMHTHECMYVYVSVDDVCMHIYIQIFITQTNATVNSKYLLEKL